RHDLGGLRGKAERGQEVPAAPRVRPEAALELSEGVLILEERDHDALCRGMLALCEPRLAAARCGPDGGRVALEDPKPLALLPLLESEPSESQEHAEASVSVPIEFAESGNFMPGRSRRADGGQAAE